MGGAISIRRNPLWDCYGTVMGPYGTPIGLYATESCPPSADTRSPSKQPRRVPSKPSISPRASTADSSRITLPQTWTNNARVVLEDQIHSLKSLHSSVESDIMALRASLENVRDSADVLDTMKDLRHNFVEATKSLGEQFNVISDNVNNTCGLLHITVVCVTELQNYAQSHHQQIKTLQTSLDSLSASHDTLSSVVENNRAESRAAHNMKRLTPHEWDEHSPYIILLYGAPRFYCKRQ
ncbi:hypothetical protein BDP27DRAFT_1425723 [Rhodocollybia butyracea]|uniref:Uncharacterized protein n=1 Tax=Rhodocollybia butyracea TaxID=206335 RepID=A0A9P5PFW5_9AGAR|nr:hypothetical protein BDP27DRAFT_1425723 [Rhodocollybia butyracea]